MVVEWCSEFCERDNLPFRNFKPVKRLQNRSDVFEFWSLDNSSSKSILDVLMTIYLIFQKTIVQRVAVVKRGVYKWFSVTKTVQSKSVPKMAFFLENLRVSGADPGISVRGRPVRPLPFLSPSSPFPLPVPLRGRPR